MTDEQTLWVYANMAIDSDEQLEGLCSSCLEEVKRQDKCTRCGKATISMQINPNFDKEKFERLKQESE